MTQKELLQHVQAVTKAPLSLCGANLESLVLTGYEKEWKQQGVSSTLGVFARFLQEGPKRFVALALNDIGMPSRFFPRVLFFLF